MEKGLRKEIRVVFKFTNEKDEMLYDKLKECTQPAKILKEIAFNYFFKENKSDDTYNKELLNVLNKLSNKKDYGSDIITAINKLSDKMDNLKVVQADIENNDNNEEIKEVSFTAEVSVDDLDDLDF